MQPSCLTFVTVSIVVFLSCHFTTVYGKCSGRWAIHACYGGNGKRSGPPLTDSRADTMNTNKMSLLEQILLSPYDITDLSNEISPAQNDLVEDTEGIAELYPELDGEYDRQRELKKTQALLATLLLENRFRRIAGDQAEFDKR